MIPDSRSLWLRGGFHATYSIHNYVLHFLYFSRMFIASLFDAHIRNIRNLNYSIYATFTVSAALELPADLAAIWGLNWLGRRSSAFLSLSLSGICMAVCGLCLGELLTNHWE